MPQSKQQIIEQLSSAAKRMRVVSEAAKRNKAVAGIVEPATPTPNNTPPQSSTLR